jgi:hypothetical protein
MIETDNWIKASHPQPNAADMPDDTLISITFSQNINRHTLNSRNILILDGNHGGKLISNRFLYHYDVDKKLLFIYLKTNAERLGPENAIEIIITGRIADFKNNQMEIPYHLRFTTR